MYKKCKVVMLATDQDKPYDIGQQFIVKPAYQKDLITGIVSRITTHGHSWSGHGIIHGLGKPQHLYILSNDEIKEGDWICHISGSKIIKNINLDGDSNLMKIIAITDSSLTTSRKDSHPNSVWKLDGALLPSISQSFIDKYVSEYNKGNKIEEVMVEYEEKDMNPLSLTWEQDYIKYGLKHESDNRLILKLNPDNTINIKTVKDSWSKEEVINLCKKAFFEGDTMIRISFDKWIETNL